MKQPRIIHINGKRWFDRRNGNTYHSVKAWADGKFLMACQYAYGYGDQYMQTVQGWLETQGWKFERYSSGMLQTLNDYCQQHGITLIADVADVGRKSDL